MADIHVSTIADFKTALQTAGATVILDNDLDFNSTAISGTFASVQATEIDGQGHTIYNIQSASSSPVFQANTTSTILWHNINFYNFLALGTGYLLSGYNVSNRNMKFSECKFQGKARRLFAYLPTTLSNPGVTKSAFNINSDCYFADSAYTLSYFIFNDSGNNFSTADYIRAIDCYFSGDARFPASTLNTSENARNVWNVNNLASTTPTLNGTYQLYNSDRATFSGGIPLTDAELKDRDSVAATGFPIL